MDMLVSCGYNQKRWFWFVVISLFNPLHVILLLEGDLKYTYIICPYTPIGRFGFDPTQATKQNLLGDVAELETLR